MLSLFFPAECLQGLRSLGGHFCLSIHTRTHIHTNWYLALFLSLFFTVFSVLSVPSGVYRRCLSLYQIVSLFHLFLPPSFPSWLVFFAALFSLPLVANNCFSAVVFQLFSFSFSFAFLFLSNFRCSCCIGDDSFALSVAALSFDQQLFDSSSLFAGNGALVYAPILFLPLFSLSFSYCRCRHWVQALWWWERGLKRGIH